MNRQDFHPHIPMLDCLRLQRLKQSVMRVHRTCSLIVMGIISIPGIAEEMTPSQPIVWHGFASQALIITDHNRFFGPSDKASLDMTEIGLNGSIQWTPHIRTAAQVLSRRAGKMDNGTPDLDYGLFDLRLHTTMHQQFGLYLGRIKNPIGLYNETRDVAFTRQGIFSPQSIYFDKVRDLLLSSDGVQFYSHTNLASGILSVRAGSGYPLVDRNVEMAYLGQNYGGTLKGQQPAYIGQIMYELFGGRWIISASALTTALKFHPAAADRLSGLDTGKVGIDYSVLSAQFNGEKWRLTSEVAFETIHFQGISAFHQSISSHSLGYYLEASYQWHPTWQSFIRHERFYADKHDKYGKNYAVRDPFLSARSRYSRIWATGIRWNITASWMIRAEYQTHIGTAILSPAENNLNSAYKHWDLFAMAVSYRF